MQRIEELETNLFIEILRQMKEKGLSFKDFEKKYNIISDMTLYNYVNGKGKPKINKIIKIHDVLKTDFREIYNDIIRTICTENNSNSLEDIILKQYRQNYKFLLHEE